MKINEIFKNVNYEILNYVKDFKYNNMEYDSRKITKGDIFIALKGSLFDGHNFIDKAILNGAKLIVIEDKNIDYPKDINVVFVHNLRKNLGFIASSFYNFPQNSLKVIGITGTNGKTTSTYILESVLTNSARIGTNGYRLGSVEIEAKNTTPESLDIIKMMKKAKEENIKYFIMEVSSHALALGRVDMLKFDGAIFTNLSQDHLDFHKDMEDYFNAKAKILNLLKDNARLIINKDDDFCKRLLNLSDSFSINEKADITGKILKYDFNKMKIEISYNNENYSFYTNLLGKYNLSNILGAIKLLLNLGYDIKEIIEKLEKLPSIKGRFELVENNINATIIVDFAHSPDGLLNILKTLQEMKKNRIITLFGAGGDRDKSKRPKMAKVAANYSDYIFITSDNPRTENPIKILNDIEKGFEDFKMYEKIIDRKEAIKKAINFLKKGDILLIAGKGHENYQIIGNKTFYFNDKEIAKNILKENDK